MLRRLVALALFASLTVCKTPSGDSAVKAAAAANTPKLGMCFGYRGNGTSIFSTVGGIARLFDQFGEPAGVSGTSSGSVAAFLTESLMVPNPVYQCQGCTSDQVNARRSFMLKSFPLWVNALVDTPPFASDMQKVNNAKQIFDLFNRLNPFTAPVPADGKAAAPAPSGATTIPSLLTIPFVETTVNHVALSVLQLESQGVKNVISPGYYKISGVGGTQQSQLVLKAIDNILNFQGLSKSSSFQRQRLMYPGLVNFEFIYNTMGIVADWYAGYGSAYPQAAMASLLAACADGTKGSWWNPIAAKPYGASNCGVEYYKLFSTYFTARQINPDGTRRLNEPMGIYIPAFVSAAAIAGNDVVAAMTTAADAGNFDQIDALKLGRQNFRVLYFGSAAYKDTITANKTMFNDMVTTNIVSMGVVPWNVGMRASAQEPATARSVMYTNGSDNYLASGGYVDQLQSKLLKMVGCDTVAVINTSSPIFGFANKYSPVIWDQDPNQTNDLFSPTDPNSAESIGFTQTNALLCARWEAYQMLQIWEMADGSYNNVVFSQDPATVAAGASYHLKDGSPGTVSAPPKQCYSQPTVRENQYEAYDVKAATAAAAPGAPAPAATD